MKNAENVCRNKHAQWPEYSLPVFVMKTSKNKQEIVDSWIQVFALKSGSLYLRAGLIFGVKNKLRSWYAYLQRTWLISFN